MKYICFKNIFFSPKECATYYVAQPSSSDHSEVKEEDRQDDADENKFSLKRNAAVAKATL